MPLIASLAVMFALGLVSPVVAARELRASPRPAYRTRAFGLVLVHVLAVAMPVVTMLLVRYGDWMVSYLIDGAHVPSVVTAGVIVVVGCAALAGFWLGARWLREHHAEWAAYALGAVAAMLVIGALLCRHRLATVGTYAQYHGQFGTRGAMGGAGVTLVSIAIVWALAVAHLLWSLRRPPASA